MVVSKTGSMRQEGQPKKAKRRTCHEETISVPVSKSGRFHLASRQPTVIVLDEIDLMSVKDRRWLLINVPP